MIAAIAAGSGLVLLGGVAWTTPPTTATTRPVQVQQQVRITYAAQAPRGAAYPTGRVRTPDPVFLRLVPAIDVRIAYRARLHEDPGTEALPTAAGTLTGTRRVTAELRSANGWHRGFELLPRERFTDARFDVTVPLDLTRVRALINGVRTVTGVDEGTYTLSVRSEIALTGTITTGPVTARPVRESFFPELTFDYDGRQLQLPEPIGTLTAVTRDRASTVRMPATTVNRLNLLGLRLPVWPVRFGSLAAGLALLAAAGLAERSRRATRPAAPERAVRRIVLDTAGSTATSTRPTPTRTTATRARVPGPRTTALSERSWGRAGAAAEDD